MLLEAQKKKIIEFQSMRNEELSEVEKLQQEIKREKIDKRAKKIAELQAAQKVIRENEIERQEREKDKERQKLEAIKMTEQYNAMLDKQERQRAEQIQAREDKIKKMMDSMGDVLKKSDHAEREQDKRILAQQMQKDREAEQADKNKKDRAR